MTISHKSCLYVITIHEVRRTIERVYKMNMCTVRVSSRQSLTTLPYKNDRFVFIEDNF